MKTTLKLVVFLALLPNCLVAQTTNFTPKADYHFTSETVVNITSSEDNRTYKMSYLYHPGEDYVGLIVDMSSYTESEMEGESIIVIDKGNSIIFVETQGMKMQMSQNNMGGQQSNNPTDKLSNYDYSKTQKTNASKTILGAVCYKYILSDADVTVELWVAPEIKLPNWFIQNTNVIDGHIMEYTLASKEDQIISTVIAINESIDKTIHSKEYKKMF